MSKTHILASIILDDLADGELLTDQQAASILKTQTSTLSVWRTTGRYALPYVKIGRHVRYKAGDLKTFINRRTVSHTGEAVSL
jgi:hypothetical protein